MKGESDMPPERSEAPDASRLTFPVQTVILVVSIVLSVVGSTWGMRSDLRDIQTRVELRQESYVEDRENMQQSIKNLQAKVELMTLEIQNLNLALASAGVERKKKE